MESCVSFVNILHIYNGSYGILYEWPPNLILWSFNMLQESLSVGKDLRVEQSIEDLEEIFEPDEIFSFHAVIQLQQSNWAMSTFGWTFEAYIPNQDTWNMQFGSFIVKSSSSIERIKFVYPNI